MIWKGDEDFPKNGPVGLLTISPKNRIWILLSVRDGSAVWMDESGRIHFDSPGNPHVKNVGTLSKLLRVLE